MVGSLIILNKFLSLVFLEKILLFNFIKFLSFIITGLFIHFFRLFLILLGFINVKLKICFKLSGIEFVNFIILIIQYKNLLILLL